MPDQLYFLQRHKKKGQLDGMDGASESVDTRRTDRESKGHSSQGKGAKSVSVGITFSRHCWPYCRRRQEGN